MNDYEIRPYEPDDMDAFLSLHTTVFGYEQDKEWFAWKYENNPYVDHVPILVATKDGELLGTRAFFALKVACGGCTTTVLQPCDAMVHPEHRRQGLFTQMTKRAIDRYEDEYGFFFNFPNDRSLPGNLKLGWRVVSERESYYRIENPESVMRARGDRKASELLGRFGTLFARGYYRLRDMRSPSSSPSVSVRPVQSHSKSVLADLYQASIPEDIHIVRDERFYEWRLGNPDWSYTTYLAEGKSGAEAAIVTGTGSRSGYKKMTIVDVVPLETLPEDPLVGLLERILTDHRETDLFVAPSQGLQRSVLRRFGFHTNSTPPLSFVIPKLTHVVRTLEDGWTLSNTDITDPENWLLTFIERDIV